MNIANKPPFPFFDRDFFELFLNTKIYIFLKLNQGP